MMFQYWSAIKTSTWFKLVVATAISYVLYLMAGFMLPILLAIGLAFGLYPLVNMITQVRVAHGMIKLSRAVAIVLALIGFILFIVIAVAFIVLPLFGQLNELLGKLPQLGVTSNSHDLEAMLQDPSKIPMLPSSFDMLTDGLIKWAMGFVASVLRNLLRSSLEIVSNLIGLIIVPFLAFYFLKDWRDLRSMAINLFNYDVQERAAKVIDDIGRTLSAYTRGLCKLSLISGFVITVGTFILGIQFPLVLGFWAILLRSGALPVKVNIIETRTVGPSLGQDSKDKSVFAFAIGLGAVILFMAGFYRLSGIIADISLMAYVILLLAILKLLDATLTLPGVAGIILSIGMAVDANVLIFEHFKEEFLSGKSLRLSMDAGFKRAFTTIFDSNITTIIASIVLFCFGTGSIRGFAITLGLGVVLSMFTAITLTQYMVKNMIAANVFTNPKIYGINELPEEGEVNKRDK